MKKNENTYTSIQVSSIEYQMTDNTKRILTDSFTFTGGEKIRSIEEINTSIRWLSYIIKTDSQEIVIKLDNRRNCCEQYGIYSSRQRRNEIIGANIHEIRLYKRISDFVCCEPEKSIIVELLTDAGPLDIILYCAHNGYYPHNYTIRINQQNIMGSI
jgi:hypothetical protein